MKYMNQNLRLYENWQQITNFLNQNNISTLNAYLFFRFLIVHEFERDLSYESYERFVKSSWLNILIPMTHEQIASKPIFEQLNNIFLNSNFDVNEYPSVELKNDISNMELVIKPDILSFIFERIELKKDQSQKSTGSFFTSREISNKMSNLVINKYIHDRVTENIRILDPACGSGEFLITCAENLLNTYSNSLEDSLTLRKKILSINIFGIDINAIAVQITKIRLFLWVYSSKILETPLSELLDYFEKEFRLGMIQFNLTETDFFQFRGEKFDIIIGNPPYNIPIPNDIRDTNLIDSMKLIKNSAAHFMMLSFKLLTTNGILGLIMPKSLSYSKGWKSLRDFLLPRLLFLEDLNKGFKEVLLEQIIIIIRKDIDRNDFSSISNDIYENGLFTEGHYSILKIYKHHCRKLDTLILGLNVSEYELFLRINEKVNDRLENHIRARRGYNIQSKAESIDMDLTKSEIEPNFILCIGGKDIKQYALQPPKRRIKKDLVLNIMDIEKAMGNGPRIIGQLANAHVLNPSPHYKLAFFLYNPKNFKNDILHDFQFLTFDTVINLFLIDNCIDISTVSTKMNYLLLYLNSNLFAWYLYKIIYSSAIRSTRLDEIYLQKVPFLYNEITQKSKELAIILECIAMALSLLSQFFHYFNNHNAIENLNETNSLIDKLDRFSNLIISYIYLAGVEIFYGFCLSTNFLITLKEFQQFIGLLDYQIFIMNTKFDKNLKDLAKTLISLINRFYNSIILELRNNNISSKLEEFENSFFYRILRSPFEKQLK